LLDRFGNEIAKTKTDSEGKYLFSDLRPGLYKIRFNLSTLPLGYSVVSKDSGSDDTKDSDADRFTGETEFTLLGNNEVDLSWDMGIYKIDIEFGQKVVDMGDAVSIDVLNSFYLQSLESTIIKLIDNNGNEVDSVVVDGEGVWSVLDNGKIQFIPEDGFTGDPTPIQYVIENEDGNIYVLSTIKVYYKEPEDLTVKIGNYVWLDENVNGIQDDNEKGIVGVVVILIDNETNSEVNRTITDYKGYYLFENLEQNKTYTLKFELPEKYNVTLQNQGDDDEKDSDVNKDGILEVKVSEDNYSYDLGIYCDCNDYKVNSDEYKEVSASSFSIFSSFFALMFIVILAYRKENI